MGKEKMMSEAALEEPKGEDPTLSNPGESELLAAIDQREAEFRGEANPPPSATQPKAEVKLPEPEVIKDDGRPKVPLRIFIASGGIRWDQMAGFKSYATRNKMGPLSIPEWRKAFNAFMNRAV